MDRNTVQALLQAGAYRDEAATLEAKAELLERTGLLELEKFGIRPGVVTAQINTVLVHAYGGPAHGITTRVPLAKFPDEVKIVGEGSLPADYVPGVLFAVGQSLTCAVVVPKVGGLAKMYADAKKMGQDAGLQFDELSVAISTTILEGLGFHPALLYMPARQLAIAAQRSQAVLTEPTIINLQVA